MMKRSGTFSAALLLGGAALLAGAEPVFLNQTAGTGFAFDLESLTQDQWARTQLIYVCSPGNPTGHGVIFLRGQQGIGFYNYGHYKNDKADALAAAVKVLDADRLEVLTYRVILVGFVLWTFTLIAGYSFGDGARFWSSQSSKSSARSRSRRAMRGSHWIFAAAMKMRSLLMVLMLIVRPTGLLGTRET